MADVLLFHHALGQTAGFLEFAEELRRAGNTVTTPDLYDGSTFTDLEAGVSHAVQVGFAEIVARGTAAASSLPDRIVYAGFSLGALPAQSLAQTRPGAAGALLFHGGVPTSSFAQPWPDGVPLQMHLSEGDEWTELDVCEALAAEIDGAELFVYPGSAHLFADPDSADYDRFHAHLLMDRTLAFLQAVD
jgi:dienelactone hydrolase